MGKFNLLFMVFAFSISARAADPANTLSYSIEEIEKFNFYSTEPTDCNNRDPQEAYGLLNPFEKSKVSQITNLGKLAWTIIKENKPTLKITQQRANALPEGLSWDGLECWSRPETRTYQFKATNGYGMDVINFEFDIRFTHGGNYKGVGAYLKNVTINPTVIDVLWGYNLNVNVLVPATVNLGTVEAPKAGSELQIEWTISTLMKISRRSMSFFITGDGEFEVL